MIKGNYNVYRGVLIHLPENVKTTGRMNVSFIFKVQLNKNIEMLSDEELNSNRENMSHFLGSNSYTIQIISKKSEVTDYDYLKLYKTIASKKNIKGEDNELHKMMTYGTARMIKDHTKGKFKHTYYIKIPTTINVETAEDDIRQRHAEIVSLLLHFPYQIKEMINWDELIRSLLEETKFYTSELPSLTAEALLKYGFYKKN